MDRFGTEIDAGMVEYLKVAGNGFDGVEDFPPIPVLSNDQVFSIICWRAGKGSQTSGKGFLQASGVAKSVLLLEIVYLDIFILKAAFEEVREPG